MGSDAIDFQVRILFFNTADHVCSDQCILRALLMIDDCKPALGLVQVGEFALEISISPPPVFRPKLERVRTVKGIQEGV